MDSTLAFIFGIITGPIGFVLFVRFVLWNGAVWLVRRMHNNLDSN